MDSTTECRVTRYFVDERIEVVTIPNPTGTNMVERTFASPIQRQLSDALAYIKNFCIAEAVVKRDDEAAAERMFDYPCKAAENAEAIRGAELRLADHQGILDEQRRMLLEHDGMLAEALGELGETVLLSVRLRKYAIYT